MSSCKLYEPSMLSAQRMQRVYVIVAAKLGTDHWTDDNTTKEKIKEWVNGASRVRLSVNSASMQIFFNIPPHNPVTLTVPFAADAAQFDRFLTDVRSALE